MQEPTHRKQGKADAGGTVRANGFHQTCRGSGDGMQAQGNSSNTGSPSGDRFGGQLAPRERRAGPFGVAERGAADKAANLARWKSLCRQLPVFGRLGKVIEQINPILRGWVNYFAVGHSSRCFAFIEDCVEKKIRRHMMRAKKRKGFGWKRWSKEWLYQVLGLFKDYRVRGYAPIPKVAPAR
jgi:hypothetical protein